MRDDMAIVIKQRTVAKGLILMAVLEGTEITYRLHVEATVFNIDDARKKRVVAEHVRLTAQDVIALAAFDQMSSVGEYLEAGVLPGEDE
jgi:hypothetical protein